MPPFMRYVSMHATIALCLEHGAILEESSGWLQEGKACCVIV